MWRYFWGAHRVWRLECNGVFRSSPQYVCRDDHNEVGHEKRLGKYERAVLQYHSNEGRRDYHDRSNKTSFCNYVIQCNFQKFAEAFVLSSTCVLSWHCSRLWKFQNEVERRKREYLLYELYNSRTRTLAFHVIDEANQQTPELISPSIKYLQNDASTNSHIEAESVDNILQNDAECLDKQTVKELFRSYSRDIHKGVSATARLGPVKENRRVRFESLGDGINNLNAFTEENKVSNTENSSENVQESHHEHLYAEFEESWKDLCERYVKMQHNKRGVLAVQKGNGTAALSHFETAGTAGCARAHFNLGLLHQTGNGCVQNLTQAIECYKEAVKNGSIEASHNLALIYLNRGHAGDHLLALDLLRQAITGGCTPSKTELGVAYVEDGKFEEAAKLFANAAKEQDADAQYFLGMCYENGRGVERNECKAVEMYDKASKSGHAQAQCHLGYFFEHGLGGLHMDKDSAKALYKKSSESGDSQAERRLKLLQTDTTTVHSDSSWIQDFGSVKLRHCTSAPSLFSCLQTNLLAISLADWEDHPAIKDRYSPKLLLSKSATHSGALVKSCDYNDSEGGDWYRPAFFGVDLKEQLDATLDKNGDQCDDCSSLKEDIMDDKFDIKYKMAKENTVNFTLGDNDYDNVESNEENSEDSEVSWCSSRDSLVDFTLDGRFDTVVDLSKNKPLKQSNKKSAYDLLLLGGGFGSVTNLSKTKTVKKKNSKDSLVSLERKRELSLTFDENCVNLGFSLSNQETGISVRIP